MSDIHFGTRNGLDDPALESGLRALVEHVQPELVVVSGDLTHGGRRAEHEAAASYLRALGPPLHVIPGNHDIPPFSPARVTHPFREFVRQWGTEPAFYSSPTLLVSGLNSVNPWGYQRGRLPAAELERAGVQLGAAEPAALRVVTLHHQLTGTPWRWRKLPLAGRGRVLATLAGAGTELVLGGHIHQVTVVARRDFEVLGDGVRDCVLATAPGLGRPRPGRRHEIRGVLVHRHDASSLTTETHVWRGAGFELAGSRSFPRS